LVGTARGFGGFLLADPRFFKDLPAPRRREISEIVVELRKSG
jgi:hypothetical protein